MAIPFKFENIVGTPVNITKYVTQVDSCKFQGSGKIRSLSLMLRANQGAFISDKDYAGTDTTPIINQFDKHKITWTDDNGVIKKMIVEVDTELGQTDSNGQLLPLEFKGREAALQRRKFTTFFQFDNPRDAIRFIRDVYNDKKGTDEPTLATVGDGTDFIATVPLTVNNIYDFTKEISFYDALMQIVRRLNQPIGTGGVGDFYSMVITDGEDLSTPQANTIMLRIFVQGVGAATNIQSSINNPFHDLTYTIESESGNQIFVRGQQGTGYVPREFHEFISFVEEINNYPPYIATETYPEGIITRGSDNKLYKAKAGGVPISTPPPNATFWTLETPSTIIPAINYSQWTKNKEVVTKNSCANPTAAFLTGGFAAPAFYDGNMVIREGFNSADGSYAFWRDFALIRTNDSADLLNVTNQIYFLFTGSTGIYNGTRVLVDTSLGAVAGDFVGTDKFGRTFADSLALFNGTDWIVIREFDGLPTSTRLGDQVVVIFEGRTYEWNTTLTVQNDFANAHTHATWNPKQRSAGAPTGVQWRDVSASAGGNDVFHHPKNIEKVDGLFPKDIEGDDYTSFVTDSAIKITFEFNENDLINEFNQKFTSFFDSAYTTLVDLFAPTDDIFQTLFEPTVAELAETNLASYYDFGWWYTLPFPYPYAKANGITEGVGDLWGAAPGVEQKKKFAVLDLQNPTFSHSGNVGFNHTEVEDMGGPFTGLRFYFLFDIKLGGARKPYAGQIPFVVTAYDDLSQVWRADFIYRFLGDAQEIEIGFNEFTVDRPSRMPWGIRTGLQNIVTPEIEIRSIFEPKRVRYITFQLADSYDDDLRYLPVNINNIVSIVFGNGVVTFEGTIDGLTLLKQPFTSSGVILDRIINPETVQLPNTRNLRQLRSVATALKELHELQFEQYVNVVDLDCSLTTEQSVNLIDPEMVKGSPRKLVNMSEDFSWNPSGPKPGGISTRTFTRRLNP